MRNLLLMLVLANLFLLGWQLWVVPDAPSGAPGTVLPGIEVPPARTEPQAAAGPCYRLGPFAGSGDAGEAQKRLAAQAIESRLLPPEPRTWAGHWVHTTGFPERATADAARLRLVAAGMSDAYVTMDEGAPVISLGVFMEPTRAEEVAAAARQLGFQVNIRDRYREPAESWLLVAAGRDRMRAVESLDLGTPELKWEAAACEPDAAIDSTQR